MYITPKVLEQTDALASRFEALINSLPTPTDENTGTFYHISTGVSRTAIGNYNLLRKAYEPDDQIHLAWACRNLLELHVFMKCILLSKAKALEFACYRWTDNLEIVERLTKFERMISPDATITIRHFDAMLDDFKQKMAAEGCVQKSYLNTREWAITANMLDEFEIMNKLCSKFVHPTAWSVLTEDMGSARFPEAGDMFFASGAAHFSQIFMSLHEHIKQYGPNHNPN